MRGRQLVNVVAVLVFVSVVVVFVAILTQSVPRTVPPGPAYYPEGGVATTPQFACPSLRPAVCS